jgi:UV DNA damage repair endonuclease
MELNHNPMIIELEILKSEFEKITDKIIKDINRHDKIMSHSEINGKNKNMTTFKANWQKFLHSNWNKKN